MTGNSPDSSGIAELCDAYQRKNRCDLYRYLPRLSEHQRAAYWQNSGVRSELEFLSVGLIQKDDDKVAALSASWLLNGKASEVEILAATANSSRQSSDSLLNDVSARLHSIRRQLSQLSYTPPRVGQEKQRLKLIEELTAQEQDLAKALHKAGSKEKSPPWIELADLRKVLPEDVVLIDIARFKVSKVLKTAVEQQRTRRGRRPQWEPERYAAWITAAKGGVKVIDLGPAERIDAAVKEFRQAIEDASKELKGGEGMAEKALRKHLDALAKLVLEPLMPHIGKSERWFISPDGNLWLVPFETLTLKNGKYAIENFHISYLTSARDLLPTPASKVKVHEPVILADPDFDLGSDKVKAEAKKLGLKAEEETRAASDALRVGSIKRLLSTAAEAKAITPSLKRYADAEPRVYLREKALEGVFKNVKNPRVLVLSTHGFFLADRENPVAGKQAKDTAKPAWENPLLRCGLLLAGCNNAEKSTGGDNGVLTGLEILSTDLRGCELVVLSACETGIGAVRSGEGVSGLRLAFQFAGAKAVVSTLWQVPDKSSARLMTLFFDNLSKKKMSKSDALRAAKLKLIEERREDFAAAHPFFWAAFTLTGE